MQRELTAQEQLFFMTRALVENRRNTLIEEVRDFINSEYRADDPEGMAMELEQFLAEMLQGTGWVFREDSIAREAR